MKLTFTKSFERTLKKSPEKDRARESVRQLVSALESGVKPDGLGLKKLRDDVWEIRAGLKTRVLFILFPGEVRLILVGNHETVKQYLKHCTVGAYKL